MKLLAHKNSGLLFEKIADDSISTMDSIVRRYKNTFRFYDDDEKDSCYKKWLEKTSIQEGVRIFPFLTYRNVIIFIMDETSLMHTGTLKSTDGCVTTAHCKMNGYEKVGFESGGNTGSALTEYGNRSGMETFFFVPEDNLFLLESSLFTSSKAHLISVKDKSFLKQTSHAFTELFDINHIPKREWRYEASMFRGMFILEYILKNHIFDWFVQTISAAFGPIGIYKVLHDYGLARKSIPRFLGVQQKANSPFFTSWKGKIYDDNDDEEKIMTQVMYDSNPFTYGTYNNFSDLLTSIQGDLCTVNHEEFYYYVKKELPIPDLLYEKGIQLSIRNEDILEKTGLIAIAGTLKAVDRGIIPSGTRVLCSLTSGISRADGKAEPDFRVTDSDKLNENYLRKKFDLLCNGRIYRLEEKESKR